MVRYDMNSMNPSTHLQRVVNKNMIKCMTRCEQDFSFIADRNKKGRGDFGKRFSGFSQNILNGTCTQRNAAKSLKCNWQNVDILQQNEQIIHGTYKECYSVFEGNDQCSARKDRVIWSVYTGYKVHLKRLLLYARSQSHSFLKQARKTVKDQRLQEVWETTKHFRTAKLTLYDNVIVHICIYLSNLHLQKQEWILIWTAQWWWWCIKTGLSIIQIYHFSQYFWQYRCGNMITWEASDPCYEVSSALRNIRLAETLAYSKIRLELNVQSTSSWMWPCRETQPLM